MGWTAAIGATIGAISAGTAAIRARQESKAREKAVAQESQRQAMQFQAQSAALQQETARQTAAAESNRQQMENERRQQVASLLPPSASAAQTLMRGLNTIYTSPLGDTSEPNVGRKKLLGN